MPNKRASYEIADFKADNRDDHLGEATALVSVFGNVDLMGDRVVKGAFARSLKTWDASGDKIPVYWSHDWSDPDSNLGEVMAARETDKGLEVDMKFDIADNPKAARVWDLLSKRRLKEFSFAYHINDERKGKDGANELTDLDILEVGPTFKGANPETELLATKEYLDALEAKAGARLSSATKSELQGIHDGMNDLTTRMRALMGVASEDAPKNDEPADEPVALDTKTEDEAPETVKSEVPENNNGNAPTPATPDPGLLAMQLRIEEMWTN